jgi:hypothetical protein
LRDKKDWEGGASLQFVESVREGRQLTVGISVGLKCEVVESQCRDQNCRSEVVWLERFDFLPAANRSSASAKILLRIVTSKYKSSIS